MYSSKILPLVVQSGGQSLDTQYNTVLVKALQNIKDIDQHQVIGTQLYTIGAIGRLVDLFIY